MNITCIGAQKTFKHIPTLKSLLKPVQGHTVAQLETRPSKTNAAGVENRYKTKRIITVTKLTYDWF